MNKPDSSTPVLVGHPFAPIGMGEHVRSAWRAFDAAGGHALIRDIYGLNPRNDLDVERTFGPHITNRLSERLNIFHINGDEVAQALPHLQDDARFESAINIIYPAWELAQYPQAWMQFIDRFDEVWAPSEFIRQAIAARTQKPVIHMPLAVDVTMSSFITRRALGLPEHAFIFLFFFDYSSYMARKNPFAVLDAFNALADRHPSAPLHLVLKHKGADQASRADADRFAAAIARHSDQIQVIDRTLTDNEVKNLVRSSDCFVSLHRSEGFGRGLAEAMALGVPTIGTGYSGNMDFMTSHNAWPIAYDLISVAKDAYPFGDGQVWAEAKLDDAVNAMEQIAFNRNAARARAAIAQKDLQRLFSPLAVGLRYLQRTETLLQ
jgi:glycosyltransferase involved in cell wall biosynthesis